MVGTALPDSVIKYLPSPRAGLSFKSRPLLATGAARHVSTASSSDDLLAASDALATGPLRTCERAIKDLYHHGRHLPTEAASCLRGRKKKKSGIRKKWKPAGSLMVFGIS